MINIFLKRYFYILSTLTILVWSATSYGSVYTLDAIYSVQLELNEGYANSGYVTYTQHVNLNTDDYFLTAYISQLDKRSDGSPESPYELYGEMTNNLHNFSANLSSNIFNGYDFYFTDDPHYFTDSPQYSYPYQKLYDTLEIGYIRFPDGEGTSWLLFLNTSIGFDPNRPNTPIWVAYEYQTNKWMTTKIGFPFWSFQLSPHEQINLNVYYALISTMNAVLSYEFVSSSWLYAGVDLDNRKYGDKVNRITHDDLYFFKNRLMGGVRFGIEEDVVIDLSAGYAFDGFYFIGNDYIFNRQRRDVFHNVPFLALRFEGAF